MSYHICLCVQLGWKPRLCHEPDRRLWGTKTNMSTTSLSVHSSQQTDIYRPLSPSRKAYVEEVFIALRKHEEFNASKFVQCFESLSMTPKNSRISYEEVLWTYVQTYATPGSLSIEMVLSCLGSFSDGHAVSTFDKMLLEFLIQEFVSARQRPDHISIMSGLDGRLLANAVVAVRCVQEEKESRGYLIAELLDKVLAPLFNDFTTAGNSMKSADIPKVLSVIHLTDRKYDQFDRFLIAVKFCVQQLKDSMTEADLNLSLKYISDPRTLNKNGYDLILALLQKYAQWNHFLTAQAVSSILYQLRYAKSESLSMQKILLKVEELLPENEQLHTCHEICKTLYSLKDRKVSVSCGSKIVTWLDKSILSTPLSETFSAPLLSRALQGTRGMDANLVAVTNLMESLEMVLMFTPCNMTSDQLGMSFDGVAGKARSAPLRALRLVEALTEKLIIFNESPEDYLGGGCVATIINAISDFSLKETCVRRILSILVHQMERSQELCIEKNERSNIAGILFGLRNWNVDSGYSIELKSLLHTVGLKLAGTRRVLDGYDMARAFVGLQLFTNRSKEVQNLLSVLHVKILQSSDDTYSPTDIGRCLYGLKSMNSSYPNATDVLAALTTKLKGCEKVIPLHHIYRLLWEKNYYNRVN